MSVQYTGTQSGPSGIILTTSIIAFISGFALGVFTIRGYLVSPSLSAERRANYEDPVESEESDIDEEDTLLDHAPNWGNALEADRRQGLRVTSAGTKKKAAKKEEKLIDVSEGTGPAADMHKTNEECKLVLVVRTDLGMTKGILLFVSPLFPFYSLVSQALPTRKQIANAPHPTSQARSPPKPPTPPSPASRPSRASPPAPPRPSCSRSGSAPARPRSLFKSSRSRSSWTSRPARAPSA